MVNFVKSSVNGCRVKSTVIQAKDITKGGSRKTMRILAKQEVEKLNSVSSTLNLVQIINLIKKYGGVGLEFRRGWLQF
jgi:hypothetical protein